MQHQYAPTRHGDLAYLTFRDGDEDKPPFVLIHGNTMTAASQDKLAQRFSDTHTVYCPDLLGHGQSARPDGLFTPRYFQTQGEAIADWLTALFPTQAVPVFGMSAGGISAMNAGCLVPERIRALILDSVFVFVQENTVAAHRGSEQFSSPTWRSYMQRQHGVAWWDTLNQGLLDVVVALCKSGEIVVPCLEDLAMPILIWQGGNDPYSRAVQGQMIVATTPRAELVYDEEAGHILSWRDPKGFRQTVREFLEALP